MGEECSISCFTRLSPAHHPTITRTDPPRPPPTAPSPGDKWTLTDAKGEAHTGFDWLIVSSAAPEALAPLVGAAKSIGSSDLDKALGQVQAGAYKPNLALMLGYTGERAKAYASAVPCSKCDVSEVGLGTIKRISVQRRGEMTGLVLHATPEFAAKHQPTAECLNDPKKTAEQVIKPRIIPPKNANPPIIRPPDPPEVKHPQHPL